MKVIKKVFDLLKFTFDCLVKWGFQYIFKYYIFYFIPVIIFRNKKLTNELVKYNVWWWKIKFINNSAWWSAIKEQFVDNLAKISNNYSTAVNFWWYVWDVVINWILYSKVKLIYIYEPQPNLVKIINENLNSFDELITKKWIKVILIPKAIWAEEWKLKLFVRDEAELWDAWVLYEKQLWTSEVEVEVESIKKYNEISIDYIKMDIEWWEWDILDWWINLEIPFNYKEWIIELHFYLSDFENHWNLKENFLNFLNKNWYQYKKTWYDDKNFILQSLEKQLDKKWEVALFIKSKNGL